jgi:membrane dipeptidase
MIRWVDGQEPPRCDVGLEHLAQHIDHVCQLAGDARHVALGSDFDGGFGTEHMPREIESIADLQKVAPLLAARGYSGTDLDAMFHGNWLEFWRKALSEK